MVLDFLLKFFDRVIADADIHFVGQKSSLRNLSLESFEIL